MLMTNVEAELETMGVECRAGVEDATLTAAIEGIELKAKGLEGVELTAKRAEHKVWLEDTEVTAQGPEQTELKDKRADCKAIGRGHKIGPESTESKAS